MGPGASPDGPDRACEKSDLRRDNALHQLDEVDACRMSPLRRARLRAKNDEVGSIARAESGYQQFGRCRHLQLREPLDAEFLWLP